MKSRQRHNSSNNIPTTKPPAKFHQQVVINSSDCQQQLVSQWDIHTNRLNYLQQIITKLQRKISKLQKAVSSFQGEFRDQISEKIAQMIQIITNQEQPKKKRQQIGVSNKYKVEIQLLRQQIENVTAQISDKFVDLDQRIMKIQALSNNSINSRDVNKLIQQRVSQVQTKISQEFDQSIIQIYQKMDGYQGKLKDINEKLTRNEQYESKFRLTNKSFNQKAQKYDLLRTSPESSTTSYKGLNTATKKKSFQKQDRTNNNIFQRKCLDVVGSVVSSSTMHKSTLPQSFVVPDSQSKSNRVVYLRQKLKEFQDINRKYDNIKESNSNTVKQRLNDVVNQLSATKLKQLSANKLKSVSKDSLQSSKQFTSSMEFNYQPQPPSTRPSYLSTIQKPTIKLQSPQLSFQRQSSAKKHSTTRLNNLSACLSSSNNKLMRNQIPMISQNRQSAKKMEKLKSIKDYLEQTESEIDESVLEPNYA